MRMEMGRGDKGETDLIGARIRKSHPRIEACGAIDELNSVLGMVRTCLRERDLQGLIEQVQRDLFALGAELATAPNTKAPVRLAPTRVKGLERAIDRLQGEAKTPKSFVLPGGTFEAALIHFVRAVCRRVERVVVALAEQERVRPIVLSYLNRLSDLLFALSLVVNKRADVAESVWQGHQRQKKRNRRNVTVQALFCS